MDTFSDPTSNQSYSQTVLTVHDNTEEAVTRWFDGITHIVSELPKSIPFHSSLIRTGEMSTEFLVMSYPINGFTEQDYDVIVRRLLPYGSRVIASTVVIRIDANEVGNTFPILLITKEFVFKTTLFAFEMINEQWEGNDYYSDPGIYDPNLSMFFRLTPPVHYKPS